MLCVFQNAERMRAVASRLPFIRMQAHCLPRLKPQVAEEVGADYFLRMEIPKAYDPKR